MITKNPRITLVVNPARRVIGIVREESLASSALQQGKQKYIKVKWKHTHMDGAI
jgi:hypothetical protein